MRETESMTGFVEAPKETAQCDVSAALGERRNGAENGTRIDLSRGIVLNYFVANNNAGRFCAYAMWEI